jgi:hypothetical protein
MPAQFPLKMTAQPGKDSGERTSRSGSSNKS